MAKHKQATQTPAGIENTPAPSKSAGTGKRSAMAALAMTLDERATRVYKVRGDATWSGSGNQYALANDKGDTVPLMGAYQHTSAEARVTVARSRQTTAIVRIQPDGQTYVAIVREGKLVHEHAVDAEPAEKPAASGKPASANVADLIASMTPEQASALLSALVAKAKGGQ